MTAIITDKKLDVADAVRSYVSSLLNFNQMLVFTAQGAMRLAAIAGWIQGIREAGQAAMADHLEACLAKQLRWLVPVDNRTNDYDDLGGCHRTSLCVVSDDGSRHGFSVMWYSLADRKVMEQNYGTDRRTWNSRRSLTYFGAFQQFAEEPRSLSYAPYLFMYNGGLLWHGSGDNSFAVSLSSSDNPWSIHT